MRRVCWLLILSYMADTVLVMLKIRLQRIGRINDPAFRIVVVEHTESTKSGNFIEKLGTYNPKTKQHTLNAERVKYWLSVGAKASGTMHNMLVSLGVVSGKKINVLPRKSPPKKGEEVAQAVAESVANEQTGEVSAEEPKPATSENVVEEKTEETPMAPAETPAPEAAEEKTEESSAKPE